MTMKTFVIVCLVLVLAGLGISCFFFQVEETEFAVVTFFGDPREIIEEPGLGFKWPWPVEDVIRIDRRVNITAPEEAEYLTGDKKNVLVSFFVAWKVKDPLKFLVTVNDRPGAESRIQDVVRSEVGARLGHYQLLDLLPLAGTESEVGAGEGEAGGAGKAAGPGGEAAGREGKAAGPGEEAAGPEGKPAGAEKKDAGPSGKPGTAAPGENCIAAIMDDITERVQGPLAEDFGIDIVAVRMRRLNFPRQNKQNVFERMEAERNRIARKYRSEGEELAEGVKADADRRQAEIINKAKQWAEETRGRADAEAARIYAEAYGKDPDFYEFVRKLEAYRNFLDEKSTIVIPADSPLLDVLEEPVGSPAPGGAETGSTKGAAGEPRTGPGKSDSGGPEPNPGKNAAGGPKKEAK